MTDWRLGVVALGLAATPVAAQVGDTLPPPDTTVVADTVAQDTVPAPPPRFVPLAWPRAASPALGVWHFDRDQMLRASVFTVADLIARLPGVMPYRSGLVLQPEAVGAFGGAGGRFEVLRDGFPLDPLDASVFDLAHVSLVDVDELTVERRPGLLRIHLRTPELEDARPYSRVEAGLAQPQIEVFRGLFMAPRFLIGPVTFGVERVETDARGEPSDVFMGWARWGWVNERRGIIAELRQSNLQREPDAPWAADQTRRDVIVRGRNEFLPGLVAEAYAGWSSIDDENLAELPAGDTTGFTYDRSSRQIGGRVAFARGPLRVLGAVRHRDALALPQLEIEGEAETSLLADRIVVGGGLTRRSWQDADATLSIHGYARARPLSFLSVFAEVETGTRGLTTWLDPRLATDDGSLDVYANRLPVRSELTSLRAGAELEWWRLSAGGALIDHSVDSLAVFGLPFDSAFRSLPGGDGRAWEAWGRLDLADFWGGTLYAEGSMQTWFSGTGWPYRPAARGTGGLGLHISPLPSGNLEVRGRVWLDHRGQTVYPTIAEGLLERTALPARNNIHADLLLRIMTVTIFARIEDWRGQGLTDIPDRTVAGPRLFYGVRWSFWN